jgi:hypothetical protein
MLPGFSDGTGWTSGAPSVAVVAEPGKRDAMTEERLKLSLMAVYEQMVEERWFQSTHERLLWRRFVSLLEESLGKKE